MGNRVVIVGEAYGRNEEREDKPFVGRAGGILDKILTHVGIDRALWEDDGTLLVTNVFMQRPPNNNVYHFFGREYEVVLEEIPICLDFPSFRGYCLKEEYRFELNRLKEELSSFEPDIVMALGATALWALMGRTDIGDVRGTVGSSILLPKVLVMPTYHPAYLLRSSKDLPKVLLDFERALK